MSKQEDWVDNNFLQRLQTRQVRPGVVHLAMGPAVISRMEQMTEPKTLVQAVGQRWQSSMADQQAQLPFVYAQPVPAATPGVQTAVFTPTVTPTVKPSQTQQPIPPLLETGKQAAKSTPTKPQAPATGKAAAKATPQTKAAVPTPTAVANPIHSPQTKASSTSPTAPLPLTPAPTQKDATVPVTTEIVGREAAGKTGAADQPLSVVKAKQVVSPTAVSPTTSSAKPKQQKAAAPAPTQTSASPTLVFVSPQTATPHASPQAPMAAQSSARSKTERPLVRPKTQASTQALVPPAKPVVKPRSTARKAPISFPSATPAAATANGRSQTVNLADGPLPVVRSEQAQVFQSPAALPLPKTAVVAPSRPAPALSTTASSSAAGGSGVIQRSPTDEAPEATNAPAETVDIDEIVAEVQRQFMRELAIEGERRGVTSWY